MAYTSNWAKQIKCYQDVPMEKVISIVYQPEIYTKKYRVFSKRVTPSHLIMLTDKELIHIKEGNATQRSASKYGGIWTYIPLDKINTILVERDNDDLLLLKISLIDNSNLQLPFSITKEKELDKFMEELKEKCGLKYCC